MDAQAIKLFTGAFPPDTRLTSRLLGAPTPIIESLHAWPQRDRVRLSQRAFLRLRPDRRYRLVVFSRWMERRVADQLRSVRRRLRYVPMGMALPEPGLEERADEGVRFVSVGRLEEAHKDVTTLLHAFGQLLEHEPQATLTIVGDGPSREDLQRLSAELDVDGSVTFTGWVDDAITPLRRADVFVHSTKNESFGRVVVEAAAVGAPVIASGVGGLGDSVDDGVNGVLVAPGDADALMEAMASLARDAERRRALGEAGPAHAAKFAMERHAATLLGIIDEATP